MHKVPSSFIIYLEVEIITRGKYEVHKIHVDVIVISEKLYPVSQLFMAVTA